jgi:hypothetical protein
VSWRKEKKNGIKSDCEPSMSIALELLLVLFGLLPSILATCTPGALQYQCHDAGVNETLTDIAKRYHVSPNKLCDWNGLELRHELEECTEVVPNGFALKILSHPRGRACLSLECGSVML